MKNKIDLVFSSNKPIKIMTHVIGGYPDLAVCRQLILQMEQSGADLIEIQIPFSDPLADGPTIMKANQQALDNGITPADCFALAADLKDQLQIPLLFMTYVNIPFQMGFETFIAKSAQAGISGVIIPDLPFDEPEGNYADICRSHGLHPIFVVSPDIASARLEKICAQASGFIYTTLKTGITGAMNQTNHQGLDFIPFLKNHTPLPIAAGFGISSPKQIRQLTGLADCAVIGSHLLNLFSQNGLNGIQHFLESLCGN
jgi:tryptophan synthase alpha chain